MGGHQKTILVVDDEEVVLKVTAAMLETHGFQVFSANNGDAAVKIFTEQTNDIDLVIMDLSMPGMSGNQACAEMLDITPEARVVISSGHTPDEAASRMDGLSVAGYITKPFERKQLIAKIDDILA